MEINQVLIDRTWISSIITELSKSTYQRQFDIRYFRNKSSWTLYIFVRKKQKQSSNTVYVTDNKNGKLEYIIILKIVILVAHFFAYFG
jgi:hypothetical protein